MNPWITFSFLESLKYVFFFIFSDIKHCFEKSDDNLILYPNMSCTTVFPRCSRNFSCFLLFKSRNFTSLCFVVHHSVLIFWSTRYAYQIIFILEIFSKIVVFSICCFFARNWYFSSETPILNICHFLSNQAFIFFPFWFKRCPRYTFKFFLHQKANYSVLCFFLFEFIFWIFSFFLNSNLNSDHFWDFPLLISVLSSFILFSYCHEREG